MFLEIQAAASLSRARENSAHRSEATGASAGLSSHLQELPPSPPGPFHRWREEAGEQCCFQMSGSKQVKSDRLPLGMSSPQ